jgi:hypothetical protein
MQNLDLVQNLTRSATFNVSDPSVADIVVHSFHARMRLTLIVATCKLSLRRDRHGCF